MLSQSLCVLLLLTYSFASHADSDLKKCAGIFYKNTVPQFTNSKIAKNSYSICYTDFVVAYSGISKTGIWSAEYLTPQKLAMATQVTRIDNFQEELLIPVQHRALLTDYRGSGYDRGHLSPSAQRTSRLAQEDSFKLTNIFPQASKNNQGWWADLEKATRAYIKKTNQPAYMITGTLFLGPKLKKIGSGVLVPSHVYKVIYFPNLNIAGAYVSVNDNSGRIDTVSINQLEKYSGVRFFPHFSNQELLNIRYDLPLTPNMAARTKRIMPKATNASTIFNSLPDMSLVSHDQYIENRKVMKELGSGIAVDVKDLGIEVIKKVLK